MILSEIGNGDVLLWMFEFFLFVIWFWLLITIFGDLFRDHEISGGAKAAWCIFIILIPFIGIFAYLIVRGGGMAGRAQKMMTDAQNQYNAQVKAAAMDLATSPADQIAAAKSLLDQGAIDQGEFERLKAKALS
jgi:hypothetical protein